MKKIVTILLAVILLVPALCAPGAARAEEKLFRVGERMLLFEKDGLSVSLEGGVVMLDMGKAFPVPADIREDSASVALTAIVENNSGQDLYIEYSGSVNGLSLGDEKLPLVSVHVLAAGSRNAVYIPFPKDRLNGADVRLLKECDLTFHVYQKPTNLNSDNILLYDVPAGVIRFDRAPYTGLSFHEGEALTVLDRDGLQVSISTVQVSKGSVYLLMGGRLVNNTGKTLMVRYASVVNGWDLGGYRGNPMLSSGKEATGFVSGAVSDIIMPVTLMNWVPVRAGAELESMELIFEVSELNADGSETLWFRAPTGKIWVNREAGTEEEPPRAAAAETAEAEEPAPAPEPEEKGFRLMYGLEYGDSKEDVNRKITDSGVTVLDENGALHAEADLLEVPGTSWDYQFTDGGKLYCVRNLNIMQNVTAADTAELYQSVRAQLVDYFGEPNGRGPTEVRKSTDSQLVEAVSAFMTGPYCDTLQHEEWYITDIGPYPLKIDLFYEDCGNREKGNYGIVIEVDIEAIGI